MENVDKKQDDLKRARAVDLEPVSEASLELVDHRGRVLLVLDADEARYVRSILHRPGLHAIDFGHEPDEAVLADLNVERRVLSADVAVGDVPDPVTARIRVALLDRVLAVGQQHRGVGVALRDALIDCHPPKEAA
jgi:hypothetical protein